MEYFILFNLFNLITINFNILINIYNIFYLKLNNKKKSKKENKKNQIFFKKKKKLKIIYFKS